MSTHERIESLRSRHASVEARIQQEGRRPVPDEATVSSLKREKLRIKDEIEQLQHR